jgi:uncharacterized protein YkwD|tara:strand:- start:40 stop:555 length:516 start_codon:yes stop_codon:yes gene_type:complete
LLKVIILLLISLLSLSCISEVTTPYLGYTKSGTIKSYHSGTIRGRQLDSINSIRLEKGLKPIVISNELNASAITHAIDISNQGRAWNFGSDLSSPQERSAFAGFLGTVRGENVSETFEGEFEVLQVWLSHPISREVILDPKATHIGLGWYQEDNGTMWWVQIFGQENDLQE